MRFSVNLLFRLHYYIFILNCVCTVPGLAKTRSFFVGFLSFCFSDFLSKNMFSLFYQYKQEFNTGFMFLKCLEMLKIKFCQSDLQ